MRPIEIIGRQSPVRVATNYARRAGTRIMHGSLKISDKSTTGRRGYGLSHVLLLTRYIGKLWKYNNAVNNKAVGTASTILDEFPSVLRGSVNDLHWVNDKVLSAVGTAKNIMRKVTFRKALPASTSS